MLEQIRVLQPAQSELEKDYRGSPFEFEQTAQTVQTIYVAGHVATVRESFSGSLPSPMDSEFASNQ